MPAVPTPTLRLTPAQATALTVIELQQNALVAAGLALAGANINEQLAAKVIEAAVKALIEAKTEWLASTQRAVQVAQTIPEALKLVAG